MQKLTKQVSWEHLRWKMVECQFWAEEGWSERRMDEFAQWGISYFVLIPKYH
jgi:hypothetical protein